MGAKAEINHGDCREPAVENHDQEHAKRRSDLLAQVLHETLARPLEDPQALLSHLCQWRLKLGLIELDEERCEQLINEVLSFRLGHEITTLPRYVSHGVTTAVWNDPSSRQRVGRLWRSLEINE